MNANERFARTFLAELRRTAGKNPMTARIAPMQWVAIAKEIGLSDQARNEAVTHLRASGYIKFHPETTEVMALTRLGVETADSQITKGPKLSDPFPNTLERICAELDYWELHLNDGEPGSNHWEQVQARIEGLRHRENRHRRPSSVTYSAVGNNVRINHNSEDYSTNTVVGHTTEPPSRDDAPQPMSPEHEPGDRMSLRNFHVDANLTDSDMLRRSDGFLKNLVASFRQAAANGSFTFGHVKLQDADLNRVHGIITEIDARRVFYACSEDENPRYAMDSLYEARRAIREASKGVWANPSCEVLVQEITATLAEFCTKAEKRTNDRDEFYNILTNMRLNIWLLVALLKKKFGSVLSPRNLPTEIWNSVKVRDI